VPDIFFRGLKGNPKTVEELLNKLKALNKKSEVVRML